MQPIHSPAREPVVAAPVAVAASDDSAVSWAAILAGAAAAAALSLILVLLGVGLGLSSVSPWAFEGVSAETFGWSTIAWISFTSIAASGLGGYLAGRLRRRWASVPSDETYFRDTAHGFLSWAVATLLTAALLTSAIAGVLGTGGQLAAAAAGTTATAMGGAEAVGARMDGGEQSEAGAEQRLIGYHLDRMFRQSGQTAPPAPPPRPPMGDEATDGMTRSPAMARWEQPMRSPGARGEAGRIVANSLERGSLSDDDADYLADVIARQTGIDRQQARSRVDQVHGELSEAVEQAQTQAREALDEARKASAYAALWLFITLLMGAFFAALFATFGGRQRDTA